MDSTSEPTLAEALDVAIRAVNAQAHTGHDSATGYYTAAVGSKRELAAAAVLARFKAALPGVEAQVTELREFTRYQNMASILEKAIWGKSGEDVDY